MNLSKKHLFQNFDKKIIATIALSLSLIMEQPLFHNQSVNLVCTGIIYLLYILTFIKIRSSYYIDRGYLVFIITVVATSILTTLTRGSYFQLVDLAKALFNILIFWLLVIIITSKAEEDFFFKVYKVVCIVVVLGVYAQIIYFYVLGSRLSIEVGGISILRDYAFKSIYRPSSLFSEPSHLARYVAPLTAYLLIKRNEIYTAVFLSIGLLLSTSGLGIGLTLLLWAMYVFKVLSSTDKKRPKFLIVTVLVAGALIAANTPVIRNAIDRSVNNGTESSRVYRAIEIYKGMPLNFKIYGVGLQNFSNYTRTYNIKTKYDEVEYAEFSSTITYLPCTTGALGLISFLYMLYTIFRRNKYITKVYVLMFLFTSTVSNEITVFSWIVFFSVIYITSDKSKLIKTREKNHVQNTL